jgi:hypothetical protein
MNENLEALQARIDQAGDGMVECGSGLRLSMAKSGTRVWSYRYQLEGVRRQAGLGSYPKVPLIEAIAKRDQMRALRDKGIDPLSAKHAAKKPDADVEELLSAIDGALALVQRMSASADTKLMSQALGSIKRRTVVALGARKGLAIRRTDGLPHANGWISCVVDAGGAVVEHAISSTEQHAYATAEQLAARHTGAEVRIFAQEAKLMHLGVVYDEDGRGRPRNVRPEPGDPF